MVELKAEQMVDSWADSKVVNWDSSMAEYLVEYLVY